MHYDGIVSIEPNSCSEMENSPVNEIAPADHENREEVPGIHHIRGLRMKNKIRLLFRRRTRRDTGSNTHRDGAIEQQLKWISSFHTAFKYLIPLLSVFVAVKYQAKSEDPFKAHPLQTWSSVSAILIYSLILLALKLLKNRQNKHLEILGAVVLANGVLSTLSLLSLLLPHFQAGLIVLYVSWALTGTIAAWPLLQCTYNWLLKGIKPLLNILYRRARILFTGWNFCQQESPTAQVTRPPA